MDACVKRLRIVACILCLTMGVAGCAAPKGSGAGHPTQANAAYQRGDLAAALRGYLAWPGGEQDPDVQEKVGNCDALLGRPAQARHAYQRALVLDPGLPEVRYNLAVLELKRAQAQLIAALPQAGKQPALQQHIQDLLAQLARMALPRGAGSQSSSPKGIAP